MSCDGPIKNLEDRLPNSDSLFRLFLSKLPSILYWYFLLVRFPMGGRGK
jgi:hypothetical protein